MSAIERTPTVNSFEAGRGRGRGTEVIFRFYEIIQIAKNGNQNSGEKCERREYLLRSHVETMKLPPRAVDAFRWHPAVFLCSFCLSIFSGRREETKYSTQP